MLVIEYTKSDPSNLSEILLGICINSNRSKVNKDSAYIVAQDLKKYSPTRLIHTYTEEELRTLLSSIINVYNGTVECREIIPTQYSVGLVRTVKYNKEDIESLLGQLFNRHRYYLNCKYIKNGTEMSCTVTHNPNIKELENSNIRLSSSLKVNASTLQFGKVDDFRRLMQIQNTIPDTEGVYTIYFSEGD